MTPKPSYNADSDEDLISLVKRGDATAFDELYDRYGQKMFSYFFRMLYKDREMAADFTQDLFLKLFKSTGSFEEGKSFSTWIYSIANNMCKNEYRKKEVRARQLPKPIMMVDAVSPDLKRFKEAVHQCTNELPEEKRTLYILRFQENLSVPDISKVLGIPEGTIKSRIFYLLKEMKQSLKEFETLSIYP